MSHARDRVRRETSKGPQVDLDGRHRDAAVLDGADFATLDTLDSVLQYARSSRYGNLMQHIRRYNVERAAEAGRARSDRRRCSAGRR